MVNQEPDEEEIKRQEADFMENFHPGVQSSKNKPIDMDNEKRNIKSQAEIDREIQGPKVRRIL